MSFNDISTGNRDIYFTVSQYSRHISNQSDYTYTNNLGCHYILHKNVRSMQHQFQYIWLHQLLRNYESPTKVVCNLLQRCHIKCCYSFLFFHKYFQVMSREYVEWQSNSSDKRLMCSNGFSLAIAYEYFVNLGNRTYMIKYCIEYVGCLTVSI